MLDCSHGMAASSWKKCVTIFYHNFSKQWLLTYEINTPRSLSDCCVMWKVTWDCTGKPPAWDKALEISCADGLLLWKALRRSKPPSIPALNAPSQKDFGQATFCSDFFFHCFPTQLHTNSYKGYVQTCTKWRLTLALGGFPRASLTEII